MYSTNILNIDKQTPNMYISMLSKSILVKCLIPDQIGNEAKRISVD